MRVQPETIPNPAVAQAPITHLKMLAPLLVVLVAAIGLGACAAPPPSVAASSSEAPQVVTVEVTVEVTRDPARDSLTAATPEAPASCAPTSLGDAGEIVIAVLSPSSLPNSLPTALAAQSGLALAQDEWKKQAPPDWPPLRLWWADSANDPGLASALAEEAIMRHCAVALISASNSDTNAAIDDVAQRWSTPLIVVDGLDDALTAAQSATLFRLTPTNAMIAEASAGWMGAVGDYNGDGSTHATLIIENNDWAKLQAQLMADAMWLKQIEVEVYPVDLPASDFSSLIARLVAKPALPDALFLRLGGDAGIQLHRQLLENGVGPARKTLIVSTRSLADLPTFWSALGDGGAWSVIVRAGAWHGTVNGASRTLVSDYARLFGRWPEMTAFAAHDALLLLTDAMTRSDSLSGADMVAAIESSDIDLAGGHYSFQNQNSTGAEQAPWMWHQWLGQPILFLQLTAPYQSLDAAAVLWPPEYAATENAFLRP